MQQKSIENKKTINSEKKDIYGNSLGTVDIDYFDYDPSGRMTGVNSITSWVRRHLDSGHHIKTLEEFKKFHVENNHFVLGLFHSVEEVGNWQNDHGHEDKQKQEETKQALQAKAESKKLLVKVPENHKFQEWQLEKHDVSVFNEVANHFEEQGVLFQEIHDSVVSEQVKQYLEQYQSMKCIQ